MRICQPDTYTKGAILYYVATKRGTQPEVTFKQDGTIYSSTGSPITAWDGNADDTETGFVTLQPGETLWVGAFKAGYEPTLVEFNDKTVFPECRPLQLLRLTEKGCQVLGKTFDPAKPKYINYRDDLKNEAGNAINADRHFHYIFERTHTYGQETGRHVKIEQISEADFRKIFGPKDDEVAPEYAENFLWTSDYYVFVADVDAFKANFAEADNAAIKEIKVVTPSRTYNALYNEFDRTATNADGSLATGATPQKVGYYGAMIEDQGRLGVKTIASEMTYTAGGAEYTTEANALTTPRIPSAYGFSYAYEYTDPEPAKLHEKDEYAGKDFMKFAVDAAVNGQEASEVLVPTADVNPRHLNVVFKFRRPNISPLILQHYDIYYDIKFNRVDETSGEAVRTLLAGSGVYVDNEQNSNADDAIYRFRVDDVLPHSAINPEFEISDCRFVGNTQNEAYSSFASNFGADKMSIIVKNNSERVPMQVEEFWLAPGETRQVNGEDRVDWLYVSHKDMQDQGDILIKDSDNNVTTIHSLFYHVETYLPDTEHYNAYEYLVKHDGTHAGSPPTPIIPSSPTSR